MRQHTNMLFVCSRLCVLTCTPFNLHSYLVIFNNKILSNCTNNEDDVQCRVKLFEGVLSDVTATKTESATATRGRSGGYTCLCFVFQDVARVTVGLAGPTIRDLLSFQENWSTGRFTSPLLWMLHGVCASVCLYIPEKIELTLLATSHVSITNVRGPKPHCVIGFVWNTSLKR